MPARPVGTHCVDYGSVNRSGRRFGVERRRPLCSGDVCRRPSVAAVRGADVRPGPGGPVRAVGGGACPRTRAARAGRRARRRARRRPRRAARSRRYRAAAGDRRPRWAGDRCSGLCRPPVRRLVAAAGRRAGAAPGRAPRRRWAPAGRSPEGLGAHAVLARWRRTRGGRADAARVPHQRGDARARHSDHPGAGRRRHRRAGSPRRLLCPALS